MISDDFSIDEYCFRNSLVEIIVIPSKKVKIDLIAFLDCKNLSTIQFLGDEVLFDGYLNKPAIFEKHLLVEKIYYVLQYGFAHQKKRRKIKCISIIAGINNKSNMPQFRTSEDTRAATNNYGKCFHKANEFF